MSLIGQCISPSQVQASSQGHGLGCTRSVADLCWKTEHQGAAPPRSSSHPRCCLQQFRFHCISIRLVASSLPTSSTAVLPSYLAASSARSRAAGASAGASAPTGPSASDSCGSDNTGGGSAAAAAEFARWVAGREGLHVAVSRLYPIQRAAGDVYDAIRAAVGPADPDERVFRLQVRPAWPARAGRPAGGGTGCGCVRQGRRARHGADARAGRQG